MHQECFNEKPVSCDTFAPKRSVNCKQWVFLRDDLDDVRNANSPTNTDAIFVKGRRELSPILTSISSPSGRRQGQRSAREPISKNDACFSRSLPRQNQRNKNVAMIENALKQHPLALHPHLEECLPPEVFDDIVDILDPEMTLESDDNLQMSDDDVNDQYTAYEPSSTPGETVQPPDNGADAEKSYNPYVWLPGSSSVENLDVNAKTTQHASQKSQDENVRSATRSFCDWVTSLGGDANNIDESTITSLFASGYETKPALSVPIHVVELSSVPAELRMSAQPSHPVHQQKASQTSAATKNTSPPSSADYTPSWIRHHYGTWYLKPSLWKKKLANEPLVDVKESKVQDTSDMKKKCLDLDFELAPLQGSKLFKDFVDKKETRCPEFLNHVAAIQADQQRQERARVHDGTLNPAKSSTSSTSNMAAKK